MRSRWTSCQLSVVFQAEFREQWMEELKIAFALAFLEGVKWIFRVFKGDDNEHDERGHNPDASMFDGDLCRHGQKTEKSLADSDAQNSTEHALFDYKLTELAKEVAKSGIQMDEVSKVLNQMVGRLSAEANKNRVRNEFTD